MFEGFAGGEVVGNVECGKGDERGVIESVFDFFEAEGVGVDLWGDEGLLWGGVIFGYGWVGELEVSGWGGGGDEGEGGGDLGVCVFGV